VTRDGVVRVADFGLARAYADGRVTQAGAVTGTVQYLAPEQIRGEPADPRSDLYSLGIVAYELLTGKLPFTGETAMAVAYKHLSDRVPAPSASIPNLPEDLDGFVASATDRDRELRPETADAMRMDLDEIAYQLPAAARLTALVRELPELRVDGGETTEIRMPLETASIHRLERHRRRRQRIRKVVGALLVLALLAGAGWGTWTYAIPHTARVPNLVGRPAGEAVDRLTALGFEVATGHDQYSDVVPEGHVIRVKPRAGTEIDSGATVTIVVSKGPPPVTVPRVEGKPLKDAERSLRRADLVVGKIRQRYDDEVVEGHVISRSPSAAELPKGSPVNLVVSKGPRPVPIPDVRGRSEVKAVAVLAAHGFEVVIEETFSAKVDRGRIIGTDPAAGTETQPGETIVLLISLGPEEFPCPSFVGLSLDQAQAVAGRYGLELVPLRIPASDGDQVISQIPSAGDRIRYGATVTVYYG
jgi:eukaryotic-like serine/threonine-protein kinase